jgi:hypothetical protein
MNEVILRINDEISLDRVVSLLAPYIKNAEIRQTIGESKGKIWDGDIVCLKTPWKIDSFTPLKREELYDRQNIS